jgi:tetratricopeptide (TPR) repeat protein
MQLMRFDEGTRLATDALRLAHKDGDPSLIAQSASTLAYGHLASGAATPALELLQDLDMRALEHRPESEGFALARLGIAAIMTGDLAQAERAVDDAIVVFGAMRHRTGGSLGETLAANLALLRGDLDRAEERAQRAYELFLVSRYFLTLPILFAVLTEIYLLRDDERSANETVRAWRETGQQGAELIECMVVARSQPAAAAAAVAPYVGLLRVLSAPSVLSPSMAAIAAEVAFVTGNVQLANQVVDCIDRAPDEHVVFGAGFPYAVARTRALALETRGDHDSAITSLRAALDTADRARVPVEVARAHVALARLRAGDRPTDAARDAEAAHAIAHRHGFTSVARDARAAAPG